METQKVIVTVNKKGRKWSREDTDEWERKITGGEEGGVAEQIE